MTIELRGLSPLLQVYDMPTSIRFYRDLLGFEIASSSPELGQDKYHWVMLRMGRVEVMLNTAYEFDEERPVPADATRVAAHGDTILYFGCPDVDAAFAELSGKGVSVKKPTVAWYGMKQMSLNDPDGYGLCYQWPA